MIRVRPRNHVAITSLSSHRVSQSSFKGSFNHTSKPIAVTSFVVASPTRSTLHAMPLCYYRREPSFSTRNDVWPINFHEESLRFFFFVARFHLGGTLRVLGPRRIPKILLLLIVFNLLPRTSRIFCPKIAIIPRFLSTFKYNPGKTNNKFIIYLSISI